jgi:hypothetical protein
MGGAYSETTIISQTVDVESSGKYLAFYFKTISNEACGNYYDYMTVSATKGSDYVVFNLDVCKTTVKPNWTKKVLDLSKFVGQSGVVLEFFMQNDTSAHSHIFIDDVGFVPNPGAEVNYRNLPPPRLAPQVIGERKRTR